MLRFLRPLGVCLTGTVLALEPASQSGRMHRYSEPLREIPTEDVTSIAWNATGERLAFWLDSPTGDFTLHSAAADGSGAVPTLFSVTGPGYQHREPRFLLDGARLYFERIEFEGTRAYTVPWDGSGVASDLLGRPVQDPVLTDDETRLVFIDDPFTAERFLLLGRAFAGGPEVVLNGPLLAGGDVQSFQIAPDGTRVVYWADEVAGRGLHSAPLDTAGASLNLSGAVTHLGSEYRLASDSQRVVFRGRKSGSTRIELFSAPLDGSSAPALLSHGAGPSALEVQDDYAVSPDGAHVVFRSEPVLLDHFELFVAPIDGSGPPLQLSPAGLPVGGQVRAGFLVSPDSARVVFRVDATQLQRVDLYVAPLDGSAPAQLLALPSSGEEDVNAVLAYDSSSQRVAFVSGRTASTSQTLFSVPLDGSAPALALDDRLSELAPVSLGAGDRLVYRRFVGDGQELVVADLDGLAAPRTVAAADVLGVQRLDPAGTHAAFVGDLRLDSVAELFVSPLGTPSVPLRLGAELAPSGNHGGVLAYVAGDERLLYVAELDASPVRTLRSVPVLEPGPGIALNETSGGAIDVDPDGVVRFADGQRRAVFQGWIAERHWLFSARVDRRTDPLVLNTSPQPYATVASYLVSADGQAVVFLSDHESDEVYELYGASAVAAGAPAKLSGALVDGGDVLPGFVLTPGGGRVVFLADADVDERIELWSSTGAGAPVRLSPDLVTNGDVGSELVLSPDGTRVYFRADAEVDERYELYGAPVDGSAPAVKLSGTPLAGTDVLAGFRVTPDGTKVLFSADLVTNDAWQLFAVDALGLSPPVNLSASLPDHDVSDILIAPGGARAVFYAARSISVHQAIFSVSLTGGPPIQLTHNAPSQGFIGDLTYIGTTPGFQLTPDGTRLLYLFDPFGAGAGGLYVRPIDGSAPAQRLNPDIAGRDALWFLVDPTGTWAHYVTGFESGYDLHRVALDLSVVSQRVAREPSAARIEYDLAYAGGGKVLVFRRDPAEDRHEELFGNFLDSRPFAARTR